MFRNRKKTIIIIISIIVILSAGAFAYGSGLITDMTGGIQTENTDISLSVDDPEEPRTEAGDAQAEETAEQNEASETAADAAVAENKDPVITEESAGAEAQLSAPAVSDKETPVNNNVNNTQTNVPTEKKTALQKQPDAQSGAAKQDQATEVRENKNVCTFSISCSNAVKSPKLPEALRNSIPGDGWVLEPQSVEFKEGDTVFDMLRSVCELNGIRMEFSYSPVYKNAYIEGINDLYEFDCGELSGWMYKVNDSFPNYGCSQYVVRPGDTVCWVYTCDMGKDTGGRNVVD